MRLTKQNVAAFAVVAALAAVAIVTSRDNATLHDSFASTDYASGGYRAWAALLEREGVAAERFVRRPIELDETIDTLISAQSLPGFTDPAARTAADLGALANWVRAGGRLVYAGRDAALRKPEAQLLGLPLLLPDVGARGELTGSLRPSVPALQGGSANRMLLVEHTGSALLADGNGELVVRYPLGRGEIIAVTDSALFTNGNIRAPGNARLAYLLGVPGKPGGRVAFDDGLHGALIDRPWYRALPLPIRVALAILAVAGVLALIGTSLPSGTPLRLHAAREPTSAEFVAALSALYARVNARARATEILVHDALAAAAQANGLGANIEPADLAARLSPAAKADDVRRLAAALNAPPVNDAEFVARAALAHTVRREWSHGRYRDGGRTAFAGRHRTRHRR